MPSKTAVLTDLAADVWTDRFELRDSAELHLAASPEWSIRKRTLRGGVSEGVDVVDLNNGALSVSILPTRGMGVWRGTFRGIDVGWSSPVKRPVNPCYIERTDRGGIGWLAGFNELLCRCGLSSNGAPGLDVVVDEKGARSETLLTLHGKIANTPAHRVAVAVDTAGNGCLSVSGEVDEAMLFGSHLRLKTVYETVPGSNRLTIRDEVVNMGGQPAELELLYHTNVGRPFLDAGARLVLSFREVAPHDGRSAEDMTTWQTYLGPTPGYTEQCYFAELIGDDRDRTTVLLRNSDADRGFSLTFNVRELPGFTVWKCTQAEADGYVTGIEPGTDLPNHRTFERSRGRVIVLLPGQSHASRIDMEIHATAADVASVQEKIAALQNRAHAVQHERPITKWSPST